METGTAWGKAGPHNLREQRVWPPPESEIRKGAFTGTRLTAVQWPPPEFEQQEQQDIEVLQTRLPVKPNQRQWPPPPPEFRRECCLLIFFFFFKQESSGM
ncbi:unnamed protein product [Gongylonema pulchrum]|uniref:ELM2 domain-containing protein n=1 Tax=Gongylonema pulchrum TaxID=637853 RepID=A0A183DHP7_9BILA|nr:unnamed protein product [Gongylonema pulchrum]